MPEFEVFDRDNLLPRQIPTVTILKARILSLNRAAFQALDQPCAVELLFDRVKRIVGLRAVALNVRHACFVRPASRSPSGPFLVSAMTYLSYYNIDTHESRQWQGWIESETLCVSLENEFRPVTSNRAAHHDEVPFPNTDSGDLRSEQSEIEPHHYDADRGEQRSARA